MTGIALFYTPGGAVDPRGVLIALASGMVYACYSVSLEATGLLAMEPYKLAFWVHLLSALLAGGCALLFGQLAWPSGGCGVAGGVRARYSGSCGQLFISVGHKAGRGAEYGSAVHP